MQFNYLFHVPASERSAFAQKVGEVARAIGASPEALLAIMHHESAGTMSPAKGNGAGYFGLIQFGSLAATDLGTTTAALQRMSRVEQMDYVQRWFEMQAQRRLRIAPANLASSGVYADFGTLMMAVLWPAGMSWDYDTSTPANVVRANPSYAVDGKISKRTFVQRYSQKYGTDFSKPYKPGENSSTTNIALYIVLAASSLVLVGFLGWWFLLRK